MREQVFVVYRTSPDVVGELREIKGIFKDRMKAVELQESFFEKFKQELYIEKYYILDTLED